MKRKFCYDDCSFCKKKNPLAFIFFCKFLETEEIKKIDKWLPEANVLLHSYNFIVIINMIFQNNEIAIRR